MSTIYSESANFSVQALEGDRDGAGTSILISAWVLLGERLETKVGADFRLPPDKALKLSEAIAKEARLAIALEEQTRIRNKIIAEAA